MNELINQFAKQPLSVKLIVLAVLVVIIIGVEYQVVLVPKKEQLATLRKQSADQNVKLVENQAIAANLPKFQEEVNILNEQLKQAVALLPNEADIHSILRQLSITAKKANIDILEFKPGGQSARDFYSEISMTLKLEGGYHDIAQFIDQVGKLSRIINISDITFTPQKVAAESAANVMLGVDCKATTFMFRGGQ